MSVCYINGDYVAAAEAKISVFDRSYLFGEGLFESFRSYQGQLPFLQEHLQRLEWSSTFLNLPFPSDLDFADICKNLLKKNGLEEARFKLVLSRQGQSMLPQSEQELGDGKTNVTLFCELLDPEKTPQSYRLKTITNYTNDALPLSSMKTTNYLVKTMARFEALDAGFNDGILINSHGHAVETTTANLFWIDKDSTLWTVMEDQGLIPGTMKAKLLKLAQEHKITIKQGVITPKDLSHSKEIFITNCVVGVMPVTAINDRQISGGEIGSITAMIRDLWLKNLKDHLS